MSLWLESLLQSFFDQGFYGVDETANRFTQEEQARCILAHLSMGVPRSWWVKSLQSGEPPDNEFIEILRSLCQELHKLPGLRARIGYGMLVALAFADDERIPEHPRFGGVDSPYSLEEYLDRAEQVLAERPELGRLGEMMAVKK